MDNACSCIDLNKLSIHHCRSVTPEGILYCVKFPYLRHLQYLTKTTTVPKSVVLQIACQNPSLESLVISLDCPEKSAEVLKEINNSPRLTKLINLVIFAETICICVLYIE